MKVEQQSQNITPAHAGVVFANKQDADKRDMSKAIGRFDAPRRSIVFVKDNGLGTKYKALADNGFQIHLAKDDRKNYFITDLLDNIAKTGMHESVSGEYSDIENKDNFKDDEGNSSGRPDIVFKEESDFMEHDIDSAMDLDFTTENLNYEHRVGLYNEDASSYTLREDVKDLLDEFEFNIDENEDGVIARVAPESLNGRKLLKLVNLLKKQEQDDDNELQEALDSNKVQFDSLEGVKHLLRRMALARKHGDIEESDEAEVELNELINQYNNSNPPAVGIEKVEAQRDGILSPQVDESQKPNDRSQKRSKSSKPKASKPSKQSSSPKKSTASRVGRAADAGLSSVSSDYRKAKSTINKVSKAFKKESLDDKLKADAEKARLAESILAESGVQIRGQQYVV
ncbi:hypothetical protein [Vibrio splendidus]|uniref:Uncharacterized protein n=1 Tax=Vibrio splendidus TaxID=29497 RepID=A0A2T5E548_VIBSP|nr:hypothetical protein [Vibrio splendidus]OEE60124.1 hypothetical protein A147_03835 [Vibrio splendidus FF-6]PTP14452.1 hypothetical protein CWO36_21205 [Vibrio splendidus]UOE82173.1 hypothetical protein LTQ03_15700 [Vibrio splendidus]